MAGKKKNVKSRNVRVKAEAGSRIKLPTEEAPWEEREPTRTISAKPQPDRRPARKQLIVSRKKVDKFNTICDRIEFTPAVCEICGFDVCGANDLGDYWDMSVERQAKVKEAVVVHKKRAHSQASQNLLYEDDLPEQWLGKNREDKEREAKEKFGEG